MNDTGSTSNGLSVEWVNEQLMKLAQEQARYGQKLQGVADAQSKAYTDFEQRIRKLEQRNAWLSGGMAVGGAIIGIVATRLFDQWVKSGAPTP